MPAALVRDIAAEGMGLLQRLHGSVVTSLNVARLDVVGGDHDSCIEAFAAKTPPPTSTRATTATPHAGKLVAPPRS